jgi:hypothetical protein
MTRLSSALFDDRIADWLEDSPTSAPSQLLETVLAAVPSIPQRAHRWRWRVAMAGTAPRFALAAALVIVVGLLGLSLVPGRSVGPGPSPSPSPSPVPTAAFGLSGDFIAFSSPWYGYSMAHPKEWSVRPARQVLQEDGAPWIDSDGVDYVAVHPNESFTPGVIVGGARLSPDRTLDEWTQMTTVVTCGETASREPVEIDGETGTLLSYPDCYGLHHLWATVLHDGVGYHIVWIGPPGTEAADRVLFDRMLVTFRFPVGALRSARPSSSP